jgi:hypothetical protein
MSSPMMRPADYSPALPHERIEEIFPDIFLVHGSARVGPAMRLNRNMAIVRSNDELSLITRCASRRRRNRSSKKSAR